YTLLTPAEQLLVAAPGAVLQLGIDIEFHRRIGENHSPDIPPVQHGTRGFRGKAVLDMAQHRPDLGDGGDPRARLGRTVPPASGVGKIGKLKPFSDLDRILAAFARLYSDRPIEQAGIEVPQPVMGRQPPGEGALARGSRSVDGDNDAGTRSTHCPFMPRSGGPQGRSSGS